jgi:hypothetical protein
LAGRFCVIVEELGTELLVFGRVFKLLAILFGLVVFVVGLWGIIKGQVGPLKGRGKSALLTLAGMVVFFVGVGIIAENASKTAPSNSSAKTTTIDQKAPSTTQTAPTAKKEPAIPGLKPVDIYLNLDKEPYNLKFGDWSKGATRSEKCGKRDKDNAELRVCIRSTDVNDVLVIDATVLGTNVAGANWLFPYLATVPFDGNEPQKAKAWVTENLPKLKEGQPVETTIGGAKFTLFGNGKTNANLEITPAQ